MRSSGHESFPCRYPWIPKAVAGLRGNPALFSDDAEAMVNLGLGKNMVRALRFWIQVMGVAEAADSSGHELQLTPFARAVFDTDEGWDPYLEDVQTLWLLHWNLSSHSNPLLAWDYILFHRPDNDIVRTPILDELLARAQAHELRATRGTIRQHFDIFLHTYVPSGGPKGAVLEDSLDCPLTELRLIEYAGEKVWATGDREPAYAFRQEEKPEISPGLFMYCLHQFWASSHVEEQTLSLRQIAGDKRSPGQIFRLPEAAIRARLEHVERDSRGYFRFAESMTAQQVERTSLLDAAPDFLSAVYEGESTHG